MLSVARARRRVKNFLVLEARRRLSVSIWQSCVAYAATKGLEAAEVRRQWADKKEGRPALRAAGFKITPPAALDYRATTKWAGVRSRRWMLSVSSEARKFACNSFRTAQQNYVSSIMGRRKGAPLGPPAVESRFAKPTWTYQVPPSRWRAWVTSTHIWIPGVGAVRVSEDPLKGAHGGEVALVSVKRDGSRWYAVIHYRKMRDVERPFGRNSGSVGVDMNVGDNGIVLSTGKRYPVPRSLEVLDAKIRKHQRINRHKAGPRPGKSPSVRWRKQNRRLRDLHREVVRVRTDWLHKVTSEIVKEFRVVVVEGFSVKILTASARGTVEAPGVNVRQKAGLNRKILQAGFGSFREMLKYKTGAIGGVFVMIDRFFPSSKLCSRCGWKDVDQTLRDRVFRCRECGLTIDRDHNAARNIRRAYEDSVVDASTTESTGGEHRPWTGQPLIEGHVLTIKSPGKTPAREQKRKRTKDVRGRSADLGQAGGAHGPKTSSDARGDDAPV
jgi:putative transposase